jgi:hypothetical protein
MDQSVLLSSDPKTAVVIIPSLIEQERYFVICLADGRIASHRGPSAKLIKIIKIFSFHYSGVFSYNPAADDNLIRPSVTHHLFSRTTPGK